MLGLKVVLAINSELKDLRSKVDSHSSCPSPAFAEAVKEAYGPFGKGIPCLPKIQTNDLVITDINSHSDAIEIMDGLLDGAILRPEKAIKQVIERSSSETTVAGSAHKNLAHKAGEVVGGLIPYVGLVGITRGASAELLGECSSTPVYRMVGEQATAGFLYGSLLTPSDLKDGEALLVARMNQGSMSAAIYATLTGTAAALDHDLPKPDNNSKMLPAIARRISISILSGAVGEFVDVEGKTSFFSAPVADSLSSTMSSAAIKSLGDSADRFLDNIQHNQLRRALDLPAADILHNIPDSDKLASQVNRL